MNKQSHRRLVGQIVAATHNKGKLAEFRDLLEPHGIEVVGAGALGLSEPEETGDTFIAKPDGWWPRAGVAAEVDSREWHLGPAEWERTVARHTLMSAAGIISLHFLPSQIRREPATVVKRIADALEGGRTRPPLPISTVPCPTSALAAAHPHP